MIRLTEDIKNDLARWDKLGYIIISASISTTEKLEDENGNVITDENGEPVRYLTDQYINSADVIHGDKKGLDNGQRTNELKKELEKSGFSFKKVWGVFEGESEKSFMVFPMKIKDGEIEEVDFDKLYDFGKKLVGDFTQWSVHVHRPGTGVGKVTNDNYKGEEDDIFNGTRPATKNDLYSTSTVNPKKPSALDHSFATNGVNFATHHELKSDHLFDKLDFQDIYNKANN